MIVHIIEQILRPKIEALTFIERFGGLAQRVRRTVSKDPLVQTVYPVCVVTPEDCPPRSEPILTPDDSKLSVSWFEETGGASGALDARFAKRNFMVWTANIRFVCWLNGVALGEDKHYFKGSAEHVVMAAVMHREKNIDLIGDGIGETIGLVSLKITPIGSDVKDPAVVFNPYTFRLKQDLFTKPHDFFGITFKVEWVADMSCAGYIPLPPIDCVAPLPFWFGGLMVGQDTNSNGEGANVTDTGVTIEHDGITKKIYALNYRFGIAAQFELKQFDMANNIILDIAIYHLDIDGKRISEKTGYKVGTNPEEAGFLIGYSDFDKTPTTYTPHQVAEVSNVFINILFINKMPAGPSI